MYIYHFLVNFGQQKYQFRSLEKKAIKSYTIMLMIIVISHTGLISTSHMAAELMVTLGILSKFPPLTPVRFEESKSPSHNLYFSMVRLML